MKGEFPTPELSLFQNSLFLRFHISILYVYVAKLSTTIHTDYHPGIISSLAFSPYSQTSFYAAGTLTPTIGPIALYDASTDEAVMYLGLGDSERSKAGGGVTQVCPLTNLRHTPSSSLTVLGIQQLHFNPMKPHILYASFRRCSSIYAWDLRGGSTNGEPLYKYCFTESGSGGRKMSNQRLRFDVDIGGRWLGIGNQVHSFVPSSSGYSIADVNVPIVAQNGDISLFDLDHENALGAETENGLENGDSAKEFAPTLKFKAHEGLSMLITLSISSP
jgi:WD40 repeat protein